MDEVGGSSSTKSSHRPIAPNATNQICAPHKGGKWPAKRVFGYHSRGNGCRFCAGKQEIDQAAKIPSFEIENEPVRRFEDRVEAAIKNNTTIDTTEKQELVLARRGQGKFRRNLEQIEDCCRLTGVRDRRFLRASHIKPWRLCETNHERLDGYNGLLLTPTFDHLFDKGYISFSDDGAILISDRLPNEVRCSLGLAAQSVNAKTFTEAHEKYLAFHRKGVFLT